MLAYRSFRNLFVPHATPWTLLVCVWILVGTSGCGSEGLEPVQGRVTFPDGSPLTTGRVVLEGGDTGLGSWGLIHPDGTFVLGTHDIDDGVPPGSYNAYIANAVSVPPEDWGDRPFDAKPLIHPKYTTPQNSGLRLQVPGQPREWEIVVEKP